MKLSVKEIADAVGGKCLNNLAIENVTSISIDSREIQQGCLFVPIKGENFDGHQYIKSVFEKGALITLTEREEIADSRLVTIYVQDTKRALLSLAKYYRSLFSLPVIAVTGSVGKTTTKDMIAAVLSGKYNVHKTQGNFNNEIGLPLTLFNLKTTHEVAVLEMGMNHFGEIHNLSTTANPHIGVITNVGTSHIENLGSREGILKAKLEILNGLDSQGMLVINGDDDMLGTINNITYPIVKCGKIQSNQYYATDISCESTKVKAHIHTPKEEYDVTINAPGEHMVYNTLVAVAIAEELDLTKEEILRGIDSYTSGKMRMNILDCENGVTIIDDTYNASPDSMKAAINVLMDFKGDGRRIAVLGDMLEMGEFAPTLHEQVGVYAAELGVDMICSVGQLAKFIYEGTQKTESSSVCKYYVDKETFTQDMPRWMKKGDTILFKASRGMQFEQMVETTGKVKLNEK